MIFLNITFSFYLEFYIPLDFCILSELGLYSAVCSEFCLTSGWGIFAEVLLVLSCGVFLLGVFRVCSELTGTSEVGLFAVVPTDLPQISENKYLLFKSMSLKFKLQLGI